MQHSKKNYLTRIGLKMPKKLPPEVDPLINQFSKDGLSCRQISDKLRGSGYNVGRTTVSNVLNKVGILRQYRSAGLPSRRSTSPQKW